MSVNAAAYFTVGPNIEVHEEDGHYWAACPGCPGFSAVADSWHDLFVLVSEFHASEGATHRGWIMVPLFATFTATNDGVTI